MIVGVGTDIIEISRIEKAMGKTKTFFYKAYTEKERDEYTRKQKRVESLAGLFSAKEAVSKALGTGFRGFSLLDIEILCDEKGRPQVTLYGGAKKLSETLGIRNIHISISHSMSHAIAFAVAEGDEGHEIINTKTNE